VRANGKLPSDGITFGSSFRSRLFLVHIDHFLGDEPNRPVIRSHGSRVIVDGMAERTGAGSVSIADRPFQGVPVGVAGEQLQNTADDVRMVVVSVAAVIDRVLSASMDPALEQAQLSEKLGVVGQPDQASRE
jgi:hypothetical protein